MPPQPKRRVPVLTAPPASPTFKFRVTPGTSFAQDAEYIVGHVLMGRPVDGPFVLWIVETLAKHRDEEQDSVERAVRLSEAVADFLADKIKKAALKTAHDDYTNGD